MKLVRIDHSRCDDIAASTYLWAPDETTLEQLEADVTWAQEAYLAAGAAAAAHAGPRPDSAWSPDLSPLRLEAWPDTTTLGELRAEKTRRRAEWEAWEAKRKAASRSFGSFLLEKGYKLFYEAEPELQMEVSWGHRHGQALDLEDTAAQARDLPGLLRRRPRREQRGTTMVVGHESYVADNPTDPVLPGED